MRRCTKIDDYRGYTEDQFVSPFALQFPSIGDNVPYIAYSMYTVLDVFLFADNLFSTMVGMDGSRIQGIVKAEG